MRNRPFVSALDHHFTGALPEADYLAGTTEVLGQHGFSAANTLACVAACRDEIAAPLLHDVETSWGQPFNLVSLAGMLTAGRTGLSAAVHHAPVGAGKRRIVFYAMPHIAISEAGTIGEVRRPGVQSPSRACGALHALQQQLASETIVEPGFDHLDAEQSLLTARLAPTITPGPVPGLVDLVHLTAQAIEDDLWEQYQHVTIGQAIDGALFTGVQIHGPGGTNYVWPRSGYVLVDGDVQVIDHDTPGGDGRGKRTRRWLARGAAATTAVVLLSARQRSDQA